MKTMKQIRKAVVDVARANELKTTIEIIATAGKSFRFRIVDAVTDEVLAMGEPKATRGEALKAATELDDRMLWGSVAYRRCAGVDLPGTRRRMTPTAGRHPAKDDMQ